MLENQINTISLFIICIALKLVNSVRKAFGFVWKGKKSQNLRAFFEDEIKKEKYEKKAKKNNLLWAKKVDSSFVLFLCTKKMTILLMCQDKNLVNGREDDCIKKIGIALFK